MGGTLPGSACSQDDKAPAAKAQTAAATKAPTPKKVPPAAAAAAGGGSSKGRSPAAGAAGRKRKKKQLADSDSDVVSVCTGFERWHWKQPADNAVLLWLAPWQLKPRMARGAGCPAGACAHLLPPASQHAHAHAQEIIDDDGDDDSDEDFDAMSLDSESEGDAAAGGDSDFEEEEPTSGRKPAKRAKPSTPASGAAAKAKVTKASAAKASPAAKGKGRGSKKAPGPQMVVEKALAGSAEKTRKLPGSMVCVLAVAALQALAMPARPAWQFCCCCMLRMHLAVAMSGGCSAMPLEVSPSTTPPPGAAMGVRCPPPLHAGWTGRGRRCCAQGCVRQQG